MERLIMTTKPTGVWLQDQDLLYRLADTKHGVSNCDEIRVTQVDGSRTMERCIERAAELMAALRASHGQASAGAARQPGGDDDGYWGGGPPTKYAPTAQAAPADGAVAWPSVRKVFLVATGEEHEGEATYTRYDDAPPPLCDSECLYTAAPTPAAQADRVTAPTYSIDADLQGIRARVAEAITGAQAFGAQGANPPPAGHWLEPFWESARWEAIRAKPVHPNADTLYLLRRLLANQHTLTGSEFRAELGKIVEDAHAITPPAHAADSVLEDAAREAIEKVLALFPFNVPIQKFTINNGPCLTADNDDEFYSVKRVLAFLTEIKTTLAAARKQGGV